MELIMGINRREAGRSHIRAGCLMTLTILIIFTTFLYAQERTTVNQSENWYIRQLGTDKTDVAALTRQTIYRRVYPGRSDSLGVVLYANDGKAKFSSVKAWEMMPSNPY